ncbi:hypothetical protein SFR_4955 [Streptomyces sp. FR-008]|nr:hypothetical protein SFR_4955 [Streptomyces sp. FR-008]
MRSFRWEGRRAGARCPCRLDGQPLKETARNHG